MKKLYTVLLSCLLSSSLIAQNFEEITGTPFEGVEYSSIAFADVNSDGDQDVLITGSSGNGIIAKLYTNDGNGNFAEVFDTPFVGVISSSIAFADVDNDNDQDVLITGSLGANIKTISKLYTNDGNGNFTEVFNTHFKGVSSGSIAFADIDNDNDQDVLITGSESIPRSFYVISKLYTNDGNGVFTEVLDTPFKDVEHSSIAFADIDNDGDQDVLITGKTDSNTLISKLYTNDGFGNFTEDYDTPFEGVSSSSIAFADVDNDNLQDVLVTGYREWDGSNDIRVAKLYTNDLNANFTEGTSFEGISVSSVAFADVDNDKDQDVLITGRGVWDGSSYEKVAKLYTNDGYGNFTEVLDTPFDGVRSSSIAFADIDNDGDQDVLITGSTGEDEDGNFLPPIAKLYRNMTIVGIDEISLFSKISIYPNPNTRLINIDLGSLNNVSIKVINVSGQLIYYKENINSPLYQFELEVAPGIYILELSDGDEKQQFKLIKQ